MTECKQCGEHITDVTPRRAVENGDIDEVVVHISGNTGGTAFITESKVYCSPECLTADTRGDA